MFRLQPKEKERRLVAVPDDLRDALKEALFTINESKRDPDICVNYDDAIQIGSLVGGKTGSRKRPFEFRYHVVDESGHSRWHLALHPLDIEDIADGRQPKISLYCCATCGHKATESDCYCDCDYVNDPYWGNIRFPDAATALQRLGIDGISDSSTSADVVGLLGPPSLAGGGQEDKVFGFIWPWIKYHRTDCQLRFEFHKGGRLQLVSIMEADWEPSK